MTFSKAVEPLRHAPMKRLKALTGLPETGLITNRAIAAAP